MQETIVNILLIAVVLTATGFLIAARKPKNNMTKKQKNMLMRILIASAILLGLQFISAKMFLQLDQYLFPSAGRFVRFLLYFLDYLIIGYDILRKAFLGIKNRRVFDENFLMAVATVGAMILAVSSNGDYFEAIAVMLFYQVGEWFQGYAVGQVGEWFQGYAVGRSRRNISELMDIRPDYANIEQNGVLEQVDPDEVTIGSVIVVQPGEKVPIDGIILEGTSTLNTSALTGESLPRDAKVGDGSVIVVQPGEKVPIDGIILEGTSTLNTSALTGESLPRDAKVGDEIISGCINMSGVLKIQTTKEFGESTVSKILDLVENASSKKSKSENFISRFAKVYTPFVCYSALALALLPPLIRIIALGLSGDWSTWIYRALTFLIISCPCALVISIPLSFFAGIGGASQAGVLVKGSNYLETLSKVKTVVFDKTGTLTQGVFEVNGIHHNEIENQKLIEYAALAESASSHPISKSLQRAYGKELDRSRVKDIQEISGNGVIAKVDGRDVAAGNDKLMRHLHIEYKDCHSTGTIIHMAIDGKYAGHIVISDMLKPNAKEAISALKKSGIDKTVMLTGDARKVAEQVSASLGIDKVYSELLPADKVSKVEELLSQKNGKSMLAFVGDGINDAPVLTRADIGIAMGAMGSDAAIEAADIVLMDDDPIKISKAIKISRKCLGIVYQNIILALGIKFACLAAIEAADIVLMDDDPIKISKAIKISRKCLGIVYQNIILALGIKFACLLLGAFGEVNMYMAIFADVGVMIIAVLNAIRCLFVKKL